MKAIDGTHSTLLVFERSEEIVELLHQFAREHQITSAWLSGLGGAMQATIAWYDIKTQQYVERTISEALEITNLTGNLSLVDGAPFWHIHGTFTDRDFTATGGHIKSLAVGITCEILITYHNLALTRTPNHETGLKHLKARD